MKTLLDPLVDCLAKPGWRSGYRAGLEIQRCTEVGKPASGPLARRGSSPFPGAILPVAPKLSLIYYNNRKNSSLVFRLGSFD
jgi:hypothetical protein